MTQQAFPVFTCEVGVASGPAQRPVSLDGIDTTALASGAMSIVTTGSLRGNMYWLDMSSTESPDGTTVIEPLAGPGRWLQWPLT